MNEYDSSRIYDLASKIGFNKTDSKKEAEREYRCENQRAAAQYRCRARCVDAPPLRRLYHRAERGEERGGKENLRGPAAGGAWSRERARGELTQLVGAAG